jgi:hypothetical protein
VNSKPSKSYPEWFLVLWDHGPWTLAIMALVVLGGVGSVAYYVDHRLGAIEDQLNYRPPEIYRPPDLTALATGDVDRATLTQQQTVYVPIYSHVYHQGGSPYLLEATLSIRNTDPANPIYLESVRYFDTEGKLAKTQVAQLIRLGPLQTVEFLVKRHDVSGGSGANFMVDWRAEPMAQQPLIEAIMVGNVGPQAISFASRGQPLRSAGE